MDDKVCRDFLDALFKNELNQKPTFSEDMQKHIEEELKRMIDEYYERLQNNKPTET